MKILVSGCAGFIGFHICTQLLKKNNKIIGVDSLNQYYSKKLKNDRLEELKKFKNFIFYKIDIKSYNNLENIFKKNKIEYIINLAAQAGVRYSIENPSSYFNNNIKGFFNILELSKKYKIKHLLFASTSSVYGDYKIFPLKEDFNTDKSLSFYASTKKTNEVMAYTYSNLFKVPTTSLRFFTIYGPWGRPDMALFKFTKKILSNKKIDIYGNGEHFRDFTYIDDAVKSVTKLIKKPSKNFVPYNCFNIGSNNPIKLTVFIKILEDILKIKSEKKYLPIQKGDMKKTHANVNKLHKYIKFKPSTSIRKGILEFVRWYKKYYKK